MSELEEKLDPERFLRIHRSTIVNFDRVNELQQNPNGEWVVVLKDGTELKLSRSVASGSNNSWPVKIRYVV